MTLSLKMFLILSGTEESKTKLQKISFLPFMGFTKDDSHISPSYAGNNYKYYREIWPPTSLLPHGNAILKEL